MASSVALHIGPQKTGTTSVQQWLAREAGRLAAAGIQYPLPAGQFNHGYAAADLLRRDPVALSALPELSRKALQRSRHRTEGAWNSLVQAAAATDDRTIISCESFSLLSQEGARQALSDLAAVSDSPVTVIAGVRPVSGLIPSYYQEMAKKSLAPPFTVELPRFLRMLATEEMTEISWMRPNWLEATWSDNGADYRVAHVRSPATATAGEPTGQTLWGLLGIAEPDDLPRSNTSLSVVGLVAWRVFIARRGGRADPVTTRTRDLVYSHRPVATDPALGGRLRLNAELRESLDRTVTDAGQLIESPDSLLRSVGGGIAHDIPEGLAVRQEAEELVRAMQRAAPRAVIHVASAALRGTYGSVPALLRDALPGASERLAR